MLSILENNFLQYIFSVSKWPPQAVVRMYTEQTSIAVVVTYFKSILKITVIYRINMKSVPERSTLIFHRFLQKISMGKLKHAQG